MKRRSLLQMLAAIPAGLWGWGHRGEDPGEKPWILQAGDTFDFSSHAEIGIDLNRYIVAKNQGIYFLSRDGVYVQDSRGKLIGLKAAK